jgi:hypothetical protein
MPVLFYTLCVLIVAMQMTDATLLLLAWCYVATRYLHSLIHITYNNVLHRVTVFFASNVLLIFLWVRLVFTYA